tara:strand:+ start:1225 stop:2259 length:1035 start_codon:yes stop_codon:yes gene_type:complete
MKDNITLSVDTLGSETKISDICHGLNLSSERNINYKYLIYGDENKIKKNISKFKSLIKVAEVIHCEQAVEMTDIPSEAIKNKKHSSMSLAIESVSKKYSDAALSFGNTGALMTFALLMIKTLPDIRRPSIASIWPNLLGDSIILDLGANTKQDNRFLIDNALLGSSLASVLFKIDKPSVGLLNVGRENNKGSEEIRLAADKLQNLSQNKIINYSGFVEGNDISLGKTNVVVTDGFSGNIALKTAEGTAKMIQTNLRNAFNSSILSRLGYALSSQALRSMSDKLDPRVHNCGILMGLNSLVVKCHGESEYKGVSYAADIIHLLLSNNVNSKIEEYMRKINESLNK